MTRHNDLYLPGERLVDRDLVDHAITTINGITRRKGIEAFQEIGRYVLDRFFGGELQRFDGSGHRSYRALAMSPDLSMSGTDLWFAVRIAEQRDWMDDDLMFSLTVSHHKALVGVRDRERRTQLAEEASADGWTVRQLQQRVQELRSRDESTRTGRPRHPALVKELRGMERAVARILEAPLEPELYENVDADDVLALGDRLLEQLPRVVTHIEALRARCERET